MGRNSKARRDAKAKSRSRQKPGRDASVGRGPTAGFDDVFGFGSRGSGSPWDEPQPNVADRAHALLVAAVDSRIAGVPPRRMRDLESLPTAVVDREAESLILGQVSGLWSCGWQPAELHRQGRLGCASAIAARLVEAAIATDHVNRRSTTLDARWSHQVAELELPNVDGRPGWLSHWARTEGLARDEALDHLVDALANLVGLPTLDPVLPPPGSRAASGPRRSNASEPVGAESDAVLDKIRGLLAKAESSSFDAEAEAFTAKAHELMTRHAIDQAQLHASDTRSGDERPVVTRVPIDAPYADVKALFLQTVAENTRCRTVSLGGLHMSSLVGFAADVTAVEMLFTSLLVQAQTAMAEAARHAPPGTRTRSQSYRSAFLVSYTHRIGDRLREGNESLLAEAEAEHGGSFLPVLRSREDAVDDFMTERYGDVGRSRVRGGYDAAGWASGRAAADNARLNSGDLAERAG